MGAGMGTNITISIGGLADVQVMLQLAQVTIDRDWPLLWKGWMRPTPTPRLNIPIVDREFTLEDSLRAAFANSGRNAYATAWAGYNNEPRYARMKAKAGGGSRILIWEGSKNPMSSAFFAGDPDHEEWVRGKEMGYGATGRKGAIAARLSEGGFFQPWDKTSATPARPIGRINGAVALAVAKGMQRILNGRLDRASYARARSSAAVQ